MPKFFTHLKLPLLAVLTSLALTSCFDHDKKDDPRPSCATKGSAKTPTTTTTTPDH